MSVPMCLNDKEILVLLWIVLCPEKLALVLSCVCCCMDENGSTSDSIVYRNHCRHMTHRHLRFEHHRGTTDHDSNMFPHVCATGQALHDECLPQREPSTQDNTAFALSNELIQKEPFSEHPYSAPTSPATDHLGGFGSAGDNGRQLLLRLRQSRGDGNLANSVAPKLMAVCGTYSECCFCLVPIAMVTLSSNCKIDAHATTNIG